MINGKQIIKFQPTVMKNGDIIIMSINSQYQFLDRETDVPNQQYNKPIVTESEILDLADKIIAEAESGGSRSDDINIGHPNTVIDLTYKYNPTEYKVNESESIPGCSKVAAEQENIVTRKLDVAENELQCSICTELFIKAVTLNCSHTFCSYCIREWKKNKALCPICRAKIDTVSSTLVVDNFIAKVISFHF